LGVIALLRPIASALDYAHSRATVHRDVKPANILLAEDGRTMLTGFGLGTVASFNNGPGASGAVAPDYVAPERLVGREVDGRVDVAQWDSGTRAPAAARDARWRHRIERAGGVCRRCGRAGVAVRRLGAFSRDARGASIAGRRLEEARPSDRRPSSPSCR